MITDYIVVTEEFDADGKVSFQRVRFYEGDVTTEDELNTDTLEMEPVKRYRRTNMYETVEYTYEA